MSEEGPRVVAERYRLVSLLGRGGMGRVWAARDELLDRDVAVKELVLPVGLAEEDARELVERAIREARAIARVDHRNVVRIFDVLFADERPWIVMELVPSRSLFEAVSTGGPLPPGEVARVGLQVLAGLRAAHRAGVLHRDVKPANVLLAEDGRVVLTDFGLAWTAGDSSMTTAGIVLGSPSYLAPERTVDGEIGPPADLWSLGATLYAAVEGKPPYSKSSPMATLTALATEPPRPPEQAGVLGPALSALLEKDPARRADADTAERLLREATQGADELGAERTERQAAETKRGAHRKPDPETDAEPIAKAGTRARTAARTTEETAAHAQSGAGNEQPAATHPVLLPTRTLPRISPRNAARRRLFATAAVLAVLATGIAARPAISAALADDSGPPAPLPSATAPAYPATAIATPATAAPVTSKPRKPHPSRTRTENAGQPIRNVRTGSCLYAPGMVGELKLWACSPIGPQLFIFAGDGTLRVRGKCVAVEGLQNGAHLQLSSCDGSAAEQFARTAALDLVSTAANKCLDVPLSDPGNDVPAQIWDCTGAGNQKWR